MRRWTSRARQFTIDAGTRHRTFVVGVPALLAVTAAVTALPSGAQSTGSALVPSGRGSVRAAADVPNFPKVIVKEALKPATDPGRFDLKVNDVVVKPAAGDGDTGVLRVAAHTDATVSETPAAGTNAADYAVKINCGRDGSGGATYTVRDVSRKTHCTITSTRLPNPTATITRPHDGARLVEGAVAHARYHCDDAGGPGVGSCTGPVPNGGLIDTDAVGPHGFTVTATDKVGHSATRTVGYRVLSRGVLSEHGSVHAFRRHGRLWIDTGIVASCPEAGPDCTGRLRSHRKSPPLGAASVSTKHVGGGTIRVGGGKKTKLVFRLGKRRSARLRRGHTVRLWINADLHRGTKRHARIRRIAAVSLR